MANFEQALEVVIGPQDRPKLSHEGGLCDDPNDPGGITDRGISLRFLKSHNIDIDGDGDVDADDIRGLSYEDVCGLYRRFFWNLVHGDDLQNQAMATKLFDMAVNMGPGRAIRIAQESAGLQADGVFGPKTFRALDVEEPATLLTSICSSQAAFYRGIAAAKPSSASFLKGWLVRAGCTLATPCRTCRARLGTS